MGLIKAAIGSAGGVLAEQWKEFFYCDSLPANVMAVKGEHRIGSRSSNTKGSNNIISNGSGIVVADGQCMIIVDQGKVAEICAEPGEFTYDASSEPTIFSGDLSESISATFANIGKRFTYGGEPPKDQRVYYFNTKELIGNKYGTPSPVPFRVVDQNVGLDIDIAIRCFGEYSYRICDPLLFYTNVCGNVESEYTRESIDGQLKSELMTALQPAFAKISGMGIRYSALPGHTEELSEALNNVLSAKWKGLRGIEIVSFGVSSVKASDEDEQMIKELQRNAAFRNPNMAAAHLVGAQAAAMQSAAANEGAGPAMAFMGMNMAGNAGGMNAQGLYQMGGQPPQQTGNAAPGGGFPAPQPVTPVAAAVPASAGWKCQDCGQESNTGKFCANCGKPQPAPQPPAAGQWACPACGQTGNMGKFCMNCGKPQPEPQPVSDEWSCSACSQAGNKGNFCMNCGGPKTAPAPKYKCSKCGWEPEDPSHPPKFCANCGDPINEQDIVR